jgi:hypothetical protein
MSTIDNCLLPASEHEAFLRFHYSHPDIYLKLKALANQDRARGEQSLDIYRLLARVHDPAIERLREERPDSAAFLARYRTLLETDDGFWRMFHIGG